MTSRFEVPMTVALLLACTAVLMSSGCGSTCDQISRQLDELRQREVERDVSSPHLIAALPLERANELIAPQVSELQPVRLQIPSAGLLDQFLGEMSLRPREVHLVPTSGQGVGIELEFEVVEGETALFGMTVSGVIQPNLDTEGRQVEIVLNASDFQSMQPQLDAGAANRLAESIHRRLPGLARAFLSPAAIASGAAIVVELIVTQSYPLIRDTLLSRLGPIARVNLRLPDIPIERIEFRTVAASDGAAGRGNLVLGITTPLAIDDGVEYDDSSLPTDGDVGLRLSGAAVAQLANWAMTEGQLPNRFDGEGQANEDGPYEAFLDWGEGDRPLRVNVFRLEPRCLRALLTARPQLRVDDGDIVLEIEEVHVDEIEGPALPGLARLFARIWVRAMRRTQSTAGTLELDIAGRPLRAQVTSVSREGDEVRMSLSLTDRATARLNLARTVL